MSSRRVMFVALSLFIGHEASSQTLKGGDIENIIDAYKQNTARYQRDFVGRMFSGLLSFERVGEAVSLKSIFFTDYLVSFSSGGFSTSLQCMSVDKTEVNRLIDAQRGKPVLVNGIVDDVYLGMVRLRKCSFVK